MNCTDYYQRAIGRPIQVITATRVIQGTLDRLDKANLYLTDCSFSDGSKCACMLLAQKTIEAVRFPAAVVEDADYAEPYISVMLTKKHGFALYNAIKRGSE